MLKIGYRVNIVLKHDYNGDGCGHGGNWQPVAQVQNKEPREI